jgi:cellulose synthase/poly-beta-1,6-N-acetylglucosamine synthase-like glycosyltransferase
MSIVNQDYPGEIEIIVAYDEGSTDNTLKILNSVKNICPSHRDLVIFQHRHTTPFRARLYCLEKFSGEYVHLFDYDNIMPPDRISKVVKHISKSNADFLFSNAKIIDKYGQDTGKFLTNVEQEHNILKLLKNNYVDINTIVISRSCAKKILEYCNKIEHKYFDWIFEDWLFALLCMKHCKVYYMDDTFILYRIHNANITFRSDIFTYLFNKERALKTLLAFYIIEYNNLSMAERKELQKSLIRFSNFLDKNLIEDLSFVKHLKMFYQLDAILRNIILKL